MTSKSDKYEFQTCFLLDLVCVIEKDIYNTMRPFNLNRVNTEKSYSSKTELTPFVQRNSADTTSGLAHKQNGHTRWPFGSGPDRTRKRGLV